MVLRTQWIICCCYGEETMTLDGENGMIEMLTDAWEKFPVLIEELSNRQHLKVIKPYCFDFILCVFCLSNSKYAMQKRRELIYNCWCIISRLQSIHIMRNVLINMVAEMLRDFL